ncbi:DNA binding protein [Streptomyces phage Shawty]|uniref:DNA binding protein n=1 Tax=Streptomyces phage Shawty TaxID=2510521 RepID=A0A411CYG9_9CAUD|nr:DNA binding protein [Streptomyces phage Shawty]
MLTIDTIRAAQSADVLADRLSAQAEVIEATESRIAALAGKAAQRMAPHGGARAADYRDEFAQVGRVAVWEALSRFTDDNVESFMRYVYTTVETTLKDAVRSERNGNAGADENAVKVFASMLELADGDVYEAAKLAQVIPPKGKRLSKDRAEAARLAWQGAVSLDKVTSATDNPDADGSLSDILAVSDDEIDGEIRPKVGHGAALEALKVLGRYAGVRITPGNLADFAAELPELVATLDDVVTLPRDAEERRYVLDAMNVLHSAVSTATEGALADDLRDARDAAFAESAEKHARVTDCVESLGAAQRDVIKHSFGLGGVTDFGWGDGCDMDGICEALGMTVQNVKGNRAKGRKAFAKRYVSAVRLTGAEALADDLEAAAAAQLTNAGRK